MSVAACADLVAKGDPDRFRAIMAAPVDARAQLFPLYAFNLEVARAPWVTEEPLIAEMRLQWWRDVVDNAASGAARAHEVAGPLHAVIADFGLPVDVLDRLIAARRWDVQREPHADAAALEQYLEDTGAGLMWLAARAMGASDRAEAAVRAYGWASGLANYLRAASTLSARGRQVFAEGSPAGISGLAERGLERLAFARKEKGSVASDIRPALLPGWQAEGLLRLAARSPQAVMSGTLGLSEFSARGRLLWQAMSGRY